MKHFVSRVVGPVLLALAVGGLSGCMTPEQAERFREAWAAEMERQRLAQRQDDYYQDDDYGDNGSYEEVRQETPPPPPPARRRPKKRTCGQKYPGSFLDIGRRECWQCPGSHPHRTVFPVNGGKACERKGGKTFQRAHGPRRGTGLLKTDCPRGWFFDIGRGKCYSCPTGYKRTVYAVDSASACVRHTGPSRTRARYRGTPG